MELRLLTTFLKVAQLQSFSKAAESLGYSQSAVTVQVQQLENELGVRLWHARMTDGEIRFPAPEACDPALYRYVRPMRAKRFGAKYHNFSAAEEVAL